MSIGWKIWSNCGTPKSNSAWKVERPMRKPPISATRRTATTMVGDTPEGYAGSSVVSAFARRARMPSASRMAWPTRVIPAPPISIRWVGPHSVTSWPNRRCQKSSRGKAIREKAPQAAISTPPTGAYQPSVMRTAAGPGRSSTGSPMASTPAAKMPNSPTRMK
jgi:hypothetical protein